MHSTISIWIFLQILALIYWLFSPVVQHRQLDLHLLFGVQNTACLDNLHLGILNSIEKGQLSFWVVEGKMEENLAGPAVTFWGFEALDSWHLYFKLLVLRFLRLHYNVKVLNFSLPCVGLVFFLFILLSLSLVRYNKFPPADRDIGILDTLVILFGGEVHESFDILRIVDESDRNNSLLNHFPFDCFHISIDIN